MDRATWDHVGEAVGGRFVLEAPSGAGSAGRVFRARDLQTGEPVALKLYRRRIASRPDRAAQEARALASVDHPAVVRYIAHGVTEDGRSYLAMAWLEGETLAARLATRPLLPVESLRLARRLSEGLAALHASGYVHRDLKPSNIVLPAGDVAAACIVDLGVARDLSGPTATMSECAYIGTPRFMAPEQIRDPESVSVESDVFALGCVLFECLCGTPAFGSNEVFAVLAQILFEPSPSARRHRPDLPAELEGLLAKMLARKPEQRPRAGERLHRALDALLTGTSGRTIERLGVPQRVARAAGSDATASSGVRSSVRTRALPPRADRATSS